VSRAAAPGKRSKQSRSIYHKDTKAQRRNRDRALPFDSAQGLEPVETAASATSCKKDWIDRLPVSAFRVSGFAQRGSLM